MSNLEVPALAFDTDQLIAKIMAKQHGVIGLHQARAAGLSNSAIKRRAKTGLWKRIERGVYRHGTHLPTWHGDLIGACLACSGLASHRSAANLWAIDGYKQANLEIVVERSRHIRRNDIRLHQTTQMAKTDLRILNGVPTTGIARTVLDLAAVVSRKQLHWTLDAVLRQELVTWPQLYDVLIRHSRKGRDGCGKLRAVLDHRYGDRRIPDSIWNRQVAQLLGDVGMYPEVEFVVNDRQGNFVARVDLAFPRFQIAIELDSKRWHLNSDSFVKDRRRLNELTKLGWTVLVFTWDDYVDAPRQLCRTVHDLIRRQASVLSTVRSAQRTSALKFGDR